MIDTEFEEVRIKSVSSESGGWLILRDDGWSFFVESKYGIEPKCGDIVRFYGAGIGYPVRGLSINGKMCFYRNPVEESKYQDKLQEEYNDKQRREFEESRPALDAAYNDLPPEFKRRIDKFRKTNPDFRWRFERYEMNCCVDAVNIATKLKSVDAITRWRELPHEAQVEKVTINDGHSGNSFGCTVWLAKLWLSNPEDVVLAHGALTPLVGCVDYGCPHPIP